MGGTRVIREQLTPAHQVFIAEMARAMWATFANWWSWSHPQVGLITSVGPQHLDTFGTIERVRDTKYELIEGPPKDGTAVSEARWRHLRGALFERCLAREKSQAGDAGRWKKRRSAARGGTRFTLTDVRPGRKRAARRGCSANIRSPTCCCAARRRAPGHDASGNCALGVSGAASRWRHRLELLSGGAGVSIIDDAFNANPVGAQGCALRVIKGFPRSRIIVTPGMVELGGNEDGFNRAFGEQMADSVDIAILVGKNIRSPS